MVYGRGYLPNFIVSAAPITQSQWNVVKLIKTIIIIVIIITIIIIIVIIIIILPFWSVVSSVSEDVSKGPHYLIQVLTCQAMA